MFIKPVSCSINKVKPGEDEEYSGIVEFNEDPCKLGRIKVRTAKYDSYDTENLPWCYPSPHFFLGASVNSIALSVPEVGSEVSVYYPTHNKYMPYYKGTTLNEMNKCTFFDDEDYPNVYGFKDSVGNFVRVNKKKKTIHVQHSSTTNLCISENGNVYVTLPDGTRIDLEKGRWKLSAGSNEVTSIEGFADGTMEFTGNNIRFNTSSVIFDSPEVGFNGDVSIATGESGVLSGNGYSGIFSNGILKSII